MVDWASRRKETRPKVDNELAGGIVGLNPPVKLFPRGFNLQHCVHSCWKGAGPGATAGSLFTAPFLQMIKKNYNSKKEDLEEEDQGEDERNVIL